MKKNIWITGAGSGIGKAIAEQYAKEGNHLILSGRNMGNLEAVANRCTELGGSAEILAFDLTDAELTRKIALDFCQKYNSIDILINNAGVSQRSLAVETEEKVGRQLMEVNFFGSVVLTRPVLEKMIAQKGGQIVVISSVVGKFGFPLRGFYAAGKHALHGYFESVALENIQHNVFVTMVCPGRIKTDISMNALHSDGKKHEKMDEGQEKGIDVNICAKKIIKAVKRRKSEVYIGKGEVMMIYLRRFAPFIFRMIASKVSAT
jgi:short-subunit dehydrogenase